MDSITISIDWKILLQVVAVAVGILGLLLAHWLRPRLERRRLENEFGNDSFDEDQIKRATQNYIEPNCSQLDPAGAEDERKLVSITSELIPLMDELLEDPGFRKHYILLADSGMGKTSFLLNYYIRNRRRSAGKRRRIAIFPLGRRGVLDRIKELDRKKETILFLDAFDEDTEAITDYRSRLQHIMQACEDFRRVVISCRTQFFAHDEEIPKETGIAKVGPRRGGEGRIYEFHKLYLAPFSEAQIKAYIKKCIPIFNPVGRREAYRIVRAIPELSTRPMLLALVPDLIASKQSASELFELYEFMIEQWLQREKAWIDSDKLRAFSESLAVDLYLNRGTRGAERISIAGLSELIKITRTEIEQWRLTARSLLNRDAAGNFKFAHRSVMEYLFVVALVRGEHRCLSVPWTDLMRQLFVSWASVSARRGDSDLLKQLLRRDFTLTGLFPLLEHPRSPGPLRRQDILNSPKKARTMSLYESLQGLARGEYVSEHKVDESVYLCDRASDSVFCIAIDWRRNLDSSYDTLGLFRMSRAEADLQLSQLNLQRVDDRDDWRAPTLEEFDLLFAVNNQLGILNPNDLYWSSDTTDDDQRLLVSFGEGVGMTETRAGSIGMRRVKLPNGEEGSYPVFSAPLLGRLMPGGIYDQSLKAGLIRVSQGGAEKFAGSLN